PRVFRLPPPPRGRWRGMGSGAESCAGSSHFPLLLSLVSLFFFVFLIPFFYLFIYIYIFIPFFLFPFPLFFFFIFCFLSFLFRFPSVPMPFLRALPRFLPSTFCLFSRLIPWLLRPRFCTSPPSLRHTRRVRCPCHARRVWEIANCDSQLKEQTGDGKH